MKGAIEKAQELAAATPNAWIPQQFENPVNNEIHERTTAQEILKDFPDGLDFLITGVGTGGHISGCAKILKAKFPKLKVFAVEPSLSPVISGGAPGPHPLQGLGQDLFPRTFTRNYWTAPFRFRKRKHFNLPFAPQKKRESSSEFHPEQRLRR